MITAVLQSRRKCYCCSTCDSEPERRDILGKYAEAKRNPAKAGFCRASEVWQRKLSPGRRSLQSGCRIQM